MYTLQMKRLLGTKTQTTVCISGMIFSERASKNGIAHGRFYSTYSFADFHQVYMAIEKGSDFGGEMQKLHVRDATF